MRKDQEGSVETLSLKEVDSDLQTSPEEGIAKVTSRGVGRTIVSVKFLWGWK